MPTAPFRQRRYTSREKNQVIAWQRQVREDLLRLLHLDDLWNGADTPLETEVVAWKQNEGCSWQELTLASTPERRIEAVLTLPEESHQLGESSVPAVVCIHGHGGSRFDVHDPETIYKGFAASLAAAGYATISTEVGQHEVYEEGRTLMGERLWDLKRCVDCLAAVPQVDAKRLGCAGLSLGGEMAMWLGALDERIAAEVSCGFLTVMDQMEENHCLCWKFEGLRELVDYADIYALTAPRTLMCQNGLQEGETQFYVPLAREALEEIALIYQDLEHPGHLLLHVHEGGHEVDPPALLSFFDRHIGTPAT